jgi:hypothetical protein
MKKPALIASLCCVLATALQAQLLQDAVSAFPAQTYALEYDSLSSLRSLPNYRNLRQQYSGEGMQRAQKDLLMLGISEDQLREVVTASGPNGFFGLLAGGFYSATAAREAAKHGMTESTLEAGSVFCSKDGFCFLFPAREEGRALFATPNQLRAIFDVRHGRAPSLRTNTPFVDLVSRMEPRSPVFGIAPGSELSQWIGGSIPESISSRLDLTRLFSNIETFGYSVKLDSKAHVSLNLICSSEQAGRLVSDTLSAASGLEHAAALAVGSYAMPFDKMLVRSSGRTVSVNLDAPIQ